MAVWIAVNRPLAAALVPASNESELIFRIGTDDAEAKMPPKKSGKQLTAQQIETLRQWVEQGASRNTVRSRESWFERRERFSASLLSLQVDHPIPNSQE